MSELFEYGKYIPAGEDEREYLGRYDPDRYKKISNTADIAVFAADGDDLYLLLVRRGNYPYKGRWCLPGGYITAGESLESTAKRELEEETGLKHINVYQVRTYSEPGREPRDNSATTLFAAYVSFTGNKAQAGDDAADAAWFKITGFNVSTNKSGSLLYSLRLENGISFIPVVEKSGGSIASNIPDSCIILDTGGLAFDHARLVIDAMLYLKSNL